MTEQDGGARNLRSTGVAEATPTFGPAMPEGFDVALVLSGGNALGTYHLGVCEDLAEAGVAPGWVVGASIGAVTAAILIGNDPGVGLERLREFWRTTAQPDSPWMALMPDEARARWSNLAGLGAMATGRPGLSRPRLPGLWSILPGLPPDRALMDQGPLLDSLARLVDFDRLNAAPERVSVVAVDLDTAEEVWFDNREGGIEPRHLLACVALLPLFPAVEVDGRLLCDAGMRNNLPVERVFPSSLARARLCIASDLYGPGLVGPASLDRSVTRAQDLGFAAQARRGEASRRSRASGRSCAVTTQPARPRSSRTWPTARRPISAPSRRSTSRWAPWPRGSGRDAPTWRRCAP